MIIFQNKRTIGGVMKKAVLSLICVASIVMCFPFCTIATAKLCANSLYPYPTIDGDLDADSGWIRANEFTFNNGLPQQYGYARMRMGKDNNNFYLSIRVNQDPQFNLEDVIILMFGPTGSSGTFQKIAIHPVDVAGAATAVPGDPPDDVQYWEANSGNTSIFWASKAPPAWIQNASGNIRVMSSSTGVTDKWYQIEMRLPIAATSVNGLVIPSNADFRMYVNTIRWQPDPANPGGYISPEVYWPQSADITVGDVNNTPPPNQWGLASLAGPCSGVHITEAYTNHPNKYSVNVNSTNNIFTAKITNSGSDSSGKVQAEIKSARFGLPGPGLYGRAPWPGNPHMQTPSGINPGQTITVSTLPWDLLNDPNRNDYMPPNNGFCSKVELTAISGANTLISNRYFYWNMHFSTASEFSHKAILDATGYRERRDGSKQQQFIIMETIANDLALNDNTGIKTAKDDSKSIMGRTDELRKIVASLHEDARLLNATQYIKKKARFYRKFVCGYRRTGESIQIKGNTAEVVEPANCYGYLLAHVGPISEWRDSLRHKDLRPLIKGAKTLKAKASQLIVNKAYQVALEEGQSLELTTHVEAAEPKESICFGLMRFFTVWQ